MATLPPASTPRRSARSRPPVDSPPRKVKIASRSPFREIVSVASGTDMEDVRSDASVARMAVAESVFAKSDELTVSFYTNSPAEARHILRNADFYRDAYTGEIDTVTGFALVASVQTCFVWQHAQAVRGIPTCYIFSCPFDVRTNAPPFHALVPYGLNREPGLILVSPAGIIRFWDSVGIGLAGGDHYHTANLNLSPIENVTNFIRSDATTYIASTSSGHLFCITLTSSGVGDLLKFHLFAPPSPSLSLTRLLPSIFASTSVHKSPEPGNINSITLGARTPSGSRDVWTLIETRVQKWNMHPEGWEELILDQHVSSLLSDALEASLDGDNKVRGVQLDLELLDIAIDGDGNPIILVSYAGAEEEGRMLGNTTSIRRIYALMKLAHIGDEFGVIRVIAVPYQSTSTSGAPMHPRIQLLLGGVIVVIQFGDAVALCARDSEYRDRLELKSITDRTLGIGVVQTDSTFLLLTASVMMKAVIDVEKVQEFDPQVGHTNLIKSIMTQAILYGSIPENPLHFSFPPEVDEEHLMRGADQLSQAILGSDPALVKRDHDLSTQMTARKEKLSWLIGFINDNGVLVKLSQKCRQKLATDAEKLYAAYQLWQWYNSFLASSPTYSVLKDAVHAYLQEAGDAHHEDVMRAFLRSRVSEVGKLIKKVVQAAIQTAAESDMKLLPETNRVVLTLLQSAFEYRDYNKGVYGIQPPMIKPWTSRPAIIDAVLGLFDATTKVIDKTLSDGSHANIDGEPYSQLPELAEVLFACVQERLDWLGSSVAADESGTVADKDELGHKFALLRPEVLETLRRTGHAESAFGLAEKYRDFSSLAALCHRDTVYPPEDNPNLGRIQNYLSRFKYEFAQELYRWYIQHGELRVMFAQEQDSGMYMDTFFTENPNNAISWLNDIDKERYGATATSLLAESEKTHNLEVAHLMLSIGKLSHLEQTFENNEQTEDGILDAFHDGLDFISVHEALVQGLKAALTSARGRQSLDNQVEIIVKAKASSLSEQKAFLQVFKGYVRQLLQGKILPAEDLVDVLTLKDNTNTVEDYSIALHLLTRTQRKNIPEARRESAFRTIWRRVYISDDWDSIRKTTNVSDHELTARYRGTALYVTLCAVLREGDSEVPHITPDEALMIPSSTEITSRWPGMSTEQVEAIVGDYDFERDKLGDYDLNDVYHRVRELAEEDVTWRQSP